MQYFKYAAIAGQIFILSLCIFPSELMYESSSYVVECHLEFILCGKAWRVMRPDFLHDK